MYGNQGLHRMTPLRTGVRLARYRTQHRWESDERTRDYALRQVELLYGQLDRFDLEKLGRDYLFETLKRDEFSYRPAVISRFPVHRPHVLRELAADGGVILSFLHHGQYTGTISSIARHGFQISLAAHADFFLTGRTWSRAMRLERDVMALSRNGVELFPAPGSYTAMRDRLLRGEIVGIASDLGGSGRIRFLGRTVGAATGAARLAIETGAPIVPVTVRRAGIRQTLTLEDPIRVAPGDDVVAVLQEIFRRHEPAILAWPEAVERPLWRFRDVTGDIRAQFGDDLMPYAAFFPL